MLRFRMKFEKSQEEKTSSPMHLREFRTTSALMAVVQLAVAMAAAFIFKRVPVNLISKGLLAIVCIGALFVADRIKNRFAYVASSMIATISAIGLMFIGPLREARTITFVIAVAIATLVALFTVVMSLLTGNGECIIAITALVAVILAVLDPFSVMEKYGGPATIPLLIIVQAGVFVATALFDQDNDEYDAEYAVTFSNIVNFSVLLAGVIAVCVVH